jgi:hypothetical protein
LKEANGLVVVPWPQPQPIEHLSAFRLFCLFDHGFLPYDLYGGDLRRFKEEVRKWRESPNWWSQLMCAYGVFSLPNH